MDKINNLKWFNEIMKVEMMKYNDDPTEMSYQQLLYWLDDEVKELKESLQFESRDKNILSCGSVADRVYFIACKIKKGV